MSISTQNMTKNKTLMMFNIPEQPDPSGEKT
jgi:hypothetical protein